MSVLLRCRQCETSHRRSRTPAPGEEVECPKCGATFVPPAGDERDEEDAPRAHRSAPRRERDEAERPRATQKRRRDADEDDRPCRVRKPEPSNHPVVRLGALAGVGLVGVLAVGAVVWAVTGRKAAPVPVAQAPAPEGQPAPFNPPNPNVPVVPTGSATAPANSPAELLEKTRRATVLIRVETGTKLSSGSGFVVRTSPDAAYVVTNFHVVSSTDGDDEPATQPNRGGPGGPPGFTPRPPGFPPRPSIIRPPGFGPGGPNQPAPKSRSKTKVTVVFHSGTPDEQAHPADVVALDPEADLATLRVTAARNVPAPLDVTHEAPVHETMPVFIYGFPGGDRTITVTEGKISQLRQDAVGAQRRADQRPDQPREQRRPGGGRPGAAGRDRGLDRARQKRRVRDPGRTARPHA